MSALANSMGRRVTIYTYILKYVIKDINLFSNEYKLCGSNDVLGESTSYIFQFYLYLALLRNFNSLLHVGIFLFGGRCYLGEC
jgi:hypothetical protein